MKKKIFFIIFLFAYNIVCDFVIPLEYSFIYKQKFNILNIFISIFISFIFYNKSSDTLELKGSFIGLSIFIIFFINSFLIDKKVDKILDNEGIVTNCNVYSKKDFDGTIEYEFYVNHKIYYSEEEVVGKEFEKIKLYKDLKLVYWKKNPDVNKLIFDKDY